MNNAPAVFKLYPGLTLALCLVFLSGCASTPDNAAHSGSSHKALTIASKMVGKPYHYGGTTPRGFDCSGLIYYSYRKAGIQVPRTTREQYHHADRIAIPDIQPGDLLFFKLNSRSISHVAIYAGQGRIIHAPSSGKQVSYAELDSAWWRKHLAAAGRYE